MSQRLQMLDEQSLRALCCDRHALPESPHLQVTLQQLIDAEATAFIGAEPHERTGARTTHRNGVRSRRTEGRDRRGDDRCGLAKVSGSLLSTSCSPRSPGAPRRWSRPPVRTSFAQPDAEHVREQLDVIATMLGRQFPKVEAMLREAAEDVTAFADFPPPH